MAAFFFDRPASAWQDAPWSSMNGLVSVVHPMRWWGSIPWSWMHRRSFSETHRASPSQRQTAKNALHEDEQLMSSSACSSSSRSLSNFKRSAGPSLSWTKHGGMLQNAWCQNAVWENQHQTPPAATPRTTITSTGITTTPPIPTPTPAPTTTPVPTTRTNNDNDNNQNQHDLNAVLMRSTTTMATWSGLTPENTPENDRGQPPAVRLLQADNCPVPCHHKRKLRTNLQVSWNLSCADFREHEA